jgi:seryl-tRNA synthetase
MIDKNLILKNSEIFLNSLKRKTGDQKNLSAAVELISLVKEKKEKTTELDALKASFNLETESFHKQAKYLTEDECAAKKLYLSSKKEEIKFNSIKLEELSLREEQLLLELPNLPSDSSPDGNSDSDNPVIRKYLENSCIQKPLTHDQVGGKLLSSEDGVKLSGTRFVVLHGPLAKLERALINFFLDKHTSNGYQEVMVPYLVTREVMTGTGQLPKFEEDLFSLKNQLSNQDSYLIPTAEVPVTNLYRDTILSEESLPVKHCAFTPCFRAEAGSAGRDTKGLIRLHQFHKVELVILTTPQKSLETLEQITLDAESCLKDLSLPYRVIERCTADLGFGGYKGYDIEVWMAGQNSYREISSCTTFSDFQARRAKIRYKDSNKKNNFVHTLNASGLAVGRTMAAILEFYQDGDNVIIPDLLVPYFGKKTLL